MKKPGPAYKMSKAGKVHLAQTWFRPNAGARKRTLIEGELYGREIVKTKRDHEK